MLEEMADMEDLIEVVLDEVDVGDSFSSCIILEN